MATCEIIADVQLSAQLTVTDELQDPVTHKAAIRTKTSLDTIVGPFEAEGVVFLQFTDDGKKVQKIDEFLNAVGYFELTQRLEARQARQ